MPSNRLLLPALLQALLLLFISASIAFGLHTLSSDAALMSPILSSDGVGISTVSIDEAKTLQASGTAMFMDVRDALDYMDSHLPGAGNLPLDSTRQKDKPVSIIVYCSDPTCGKAATMAKQMQDNGLEVLVMPDGAGGWASSGNMMEMSQ